MKIKGSYVKLNGSYSSVKKRSIVISGHKTSITLEVEFWDEFGTMAHQRKITLSQLASEIERTQKPEQSLSSTIRVYLLNDVIHRMQVGAKVVAAAQAKLKAFSASHEAPSMVREGLAPISAVIAKGRSNA